jgi:hypothetical protein
VNKRKGRATVIVIVLVAPPTKPSNPPPAKDFGNWFHKLKVAVVEVVILASFLAFGYDYLGDKIKERTGESDRHVRSTSANSAARCASGKASHCKCAEP